MSNISQLNRQINVDMTSKLFVNGYQYIPRSLHLGLIWNLKSVSWLHVITLSPLSCLSSEQLTDTTVS